MRWDTDASRTCAILIDCVGQSYWSLEMNITGSPCALQAHQIGANDSYIVLMENSFGVTVK